MKVTVLFRAAFRPSATVFLAVVTASLCGAVPGFSQAPRQDGLALTGGAGISHHAAAAIIGNPHELPCWSCHKGETGGNTEAGYGLKDDSVAVCRNCHPDSNIHPVGILPTTKPSDAGEVWLPLGIGAHEGQIVCYTCHYLHADTYRKNLLRGDTGGGGKRRETICPVCHGNTLAKKSPHTRDGGGCTFCHMSPPKEEDTATSVLRSGVLNRCDFCHDTLQDRHFLAVNPFSDPALSQDGAIKAIPLLDGRFTCVSCHDPHDAGNRRRKMLRPAYLDLASRSNRINPHWKDVMCPACHEGEPAKGVPSLRFGGDINKLCDRCHDGVAARRDIHPVAVIPSDRVRIPDGMPLEGGFLTCSTCHESALQEGGEGRGSAERTNPNFLRGDPSSRNEFCFRCHIQEYYGQLNAHDQVSPGGTVREQSCLFCHSSLPNVKVAGIEGVEFKAENLEDYCVWCHQRGDDLYWKQHPKGPHLVEPSRDILRAIDTAVDRIGVELPLYMGRITCITCHNPHQSGVLEVEASAKGSEVDARLRLASGPWVCIGCHVEKGGE